MTNNEIMQAKLELADTQHEFERICQFDSDILKYLDYTNEFGLDRRLAFLLDRDERFTEIYKSMGIPSSESFDDRRMYDVVLAQESLGEAAAWTGKAMVSLIRRFWRWIANLINGYSRKLNAAQQTLASAFSLMQQSPKTAITLGENGWFYPETELDNYFGISKKFTPEEFKVILDKFVSEGDKKPDSPELNIKGGAARSEFNKLDKMLADLQSTARTFPKYTTTTYVGKNVLLGSINKAAQYCEAVRNSFESYVSLQNQIKKVIAGLDRSKAAAINKKANSLGSKAAGFINKVRGKKTENANREMTEDEIKNRGVLARMGDRMGLTQSGINANYEQVKVTLNKFMQGTRIWNEYIQNAVDILSKYSAAIATYSTMNGLPLNQQALKTPDAK